MCTAHEDKFVYSPPGTYLARQLKKTIHLSVAYDARTANHPAQTFDARTNPPVHPSTHAETLPPAFTTLAGKTATCPALMIMNDDGYETPLGMMMRTPFSGFFDDINAMFFLEDEMPPAIGEYMSMMLFDSDEDQPLEDEKEDDLVDEENNVPEVEVDMADFTLNLDRDESEVHIDGGAADEEGDEDLDVIDNERWDSLDEGSDDDMRRRNVLKNLGKEKRCNLGNVHKASFYVGQKFKSKKELKDLINNCSCRKWELIGILCKHAIATLNGMTKN
ncbi:hypothetical protein LXL04_029054 [Taraxacum kok-saghyz]